MGGTLKKLRLTKYPTQNEFAIAAECTREYVVKFEGSKESDPSLSTLQNMAAALKIPTYELVKQLLKEK